MDRNLISTVYAELRQCAPDAGLGSYQGGGGDFANVGFHLAADYGAPGESGWAVCKITLKTGPHAGRAYQARFKWRGYLDDPSKLTELLLDTYRKYEAGYLR